MSEPISELRSVTCHMGSHCVTCHLTEVNAPRLNPSQIGRYSIYLPRRDGRLSWPRRLVRWFTCPQAVTHRSISRARRTVTSLIGSDALPLHHAYHPTVCHNYVGKLQLFVSPFLLKPWCYFMYICYCCH